MADDTKQSDHCPFPECRDREKQRRTMDHFQWTLDQILSRIGTVETSVQNITVEIIGNGKPGIKERLNLQEKAAREAADKASMDRFIARYSLGLGIVCLLSVVATAIIRYLMNGGS